MKFCILAGVLLVASAGTGLSQTIPESSTIWIDVPYVAQTKEGCGSASISMVMEYWEHKEGRTVSANADPSRIQAALFSSAAGGIYASSMQRYFRDAGYRVFAFSARWSDLQHHLQLGRPLIVSLKASGPGGPLHYVVVVGIDSGRGYLFVNDPARRKMLRISRKEFETEWGSTRDWALLAVPQAGG